MGSGPGRGRGRGWAQTIDMLKRHRAAIESQSIRAPVIVTGLPRSGTSAMVNLLGQHAALASLPMYQAFLPAGLHGEPLTADAFAAATQDPRISVVQRCVWSCLVPCRGYWHRSHASHVLCNTVMAFRVATVARWMMPASLLAVHSFGAEHAEECIMLFQSSFARYVMLRCCRGGGSATRPPWCYQSWACTRVQVSV